MDDLYEEVGFENKDALWVKYKCLVKHEVLMLQRRLPVNVEYDDLFQVGAIGFILAVDSFDANKGVELSVWIKQRVRWSLMDELRERDWVPRRIREHDRQMAGIINILEQGKGRVASNRDIAEYMGVSLEALQKIRLDNHIIKIRSLNELQGNDEVCWERLKEKNEFQDPLNKLIKGDVALCMAKQLEYIPVRERKIIHLYYYYGLNMREIAIVLNVTETRISQLHALAIKKLRSQMVLIL
ncbi:RNA polymerase sigma factor FliA [Pantoea sp. EA-12]|uniref:RNA polymerase sigma factor FliA n=1 Tax=Pantoea sp. EA-12 TaxID=3043303 RepID=UPI0024B4DDAA|nr:RNA polymerase sigma factor FliA [Pantoea sp. EA-12]MDI9220559.1 RNA polymerase sigma factor FliA [Pantoea sp. EA-12]